MPTKENRDTAKKTAKNTAKKTAMACQYTEEENAIFVKWCSVYWDPTKDDHARKKLSKTLSTRFQEEH
jgi:hypothetical protein